MASLGNARRDKENAALTTAPNSPVVHTTIDIAKFADENFSLDSYLFNTLSQTAEDNVRSFHTALRDARSSAANDLQRNVYRNYPEFVKISKEIANLEGDMLQLRGFLNELKEINGNLQIEEVAPFDAREITGKLSLESNTHRKISGGNMKKNSMTTQEQIEAKQLQMAQIFDNIENLEKVLPQNPTRYLVRDFATQITEINLSTLKSKQPALLTIFNDAIVFSVKKKNIVNGKSKMLVEKIWRMDEVSIIGVKDTNDMYNAFRISKISDVSMFKCESAEDKTAFMAIAKRTIDEFVTNKRNAENQREAFADRTLLSPLLSPGDLSPFSLSKATQFDDKNAVRTKRKDLRDELSSGDSKWLMEVPDELDVYIAHREWDEAIDLVMKAKLLLAQTTYDNQRTLLIRARLDDRIGKLSSLISGDLSAPRVTKGQVKRGIGRLLRLGMQTQARNIFLQARRKILKARIREIRLDGDVKHYVDSLATNVFTFLKHTCDWYSASFNEPEMTSDFLKWIKSEIEQYADLFRQQVFQSGASFTTMAECIQITINSCKMLRSVGLDISFLLENVFLRDLERSIDKIAKTSERLISTSVKRDSWKVITTDGLLENGSEGNTSYKNLFGNMKISVTSSMFVLYRCVMEFFADMELVLSVALYTKISSCLYNMLLRYCESLLLRVAEENELQKQVGVSLDYEFLVRHFIPRVISSIQDKFERSVPELDDLLRKVEDMHKKSLQKLIDNVMRKLLSKDVCDLQTLDYSEYGPLSDSAKPSDGILKLVSESHHLVLSIDSALDKETAIVSKLTGAIFEAIDQVIFKESCSFGSQGIQQFLLDMQLLVQTYGKYMTDDSISIATGLSEKALKLFLSDSKNAKTLLKPGSWYERKALEIRSQLGGEFKSFGEVEIVDH